MRRFSILIALLISSVVIAQNTKGIVYYKSANGGSEVLPFAQVYHIEGSKLLECDDRGVFEIKLDTKATLVATYVGYSQDTLVVEPGTKLIEFFLTGGNEVEQSVITARQSALPRLNTIKSEVITAAGLCKLACCSLAESFENSASVSVGYSDAITGAKQIKLLGLSGIYTSMLDENRPVMRGLAAPFGLSYVPGQWLSSIQIGKGTASTVNGAESISGQINLEHRKPSDETPLFVNLYASSDVMAEANIASALKINDRWNTILLGHYSGSYVPMDHNSDGFQDEPLVNKFIFNNRWLYIDPNGTQLQFGIKALSDDRRSGQLGYDHNMSWDDNLAQQDKWGSRVQNRNLGAYFKLGIPFDAEQTKSIAVIGDGSYYDINSFYGHTRYIGSQGSAHLNVAFQHFVDDMHSYKVGASVTYDKYNERYNPNDWSNPRTKLPIDTLMGRDEILAGIFGEYTFKYDEKVSVVAGARVDYNSYFNKIVVSPMLNARYSFTEDLVFRVSAGRGFHSPNPFTDNMGILATGRMVDISEKLNLEQAWTYGGNFTAYLPFGYENNSYISLEYFRSDFTNQVYADQEFANGFVRLYNTDRAFTNTYQLDFSSDINKHITLVATFRYTDAKIKVQGQGLIERPMTSKYKAVLNAQFKTNMDKWVFDLTAQLNGPMKLPKFCYMNYPDLYSPVYPMLYFQVTHKFRILDAYVGVENITGVKQADAIISADNPFSPEFNASAVWGPLMGQKFYIGLRYTLWRK